MIGTLETILTKFERDQRGFARFNEASRLVIDREIALPVRRDAQYAKRSLRSLFVFLALSDHCFLTCKWVRFARRLFGRSPQISTLG